jgi:DNA-binding NarL/FixJ family response regulator
VINENTVIKVLTVDDHPVVRDGLNAIISSETDMQVVGEAGTGAEAVQAYFRLRPAVVLMDLRLPDMGGSEAIRQICEKSSSAQIIVLTTLDGDEEIYRALEAGARGYLLKDMARRELIRAIRDVNAGRRYIPAEVGSRIAESFPRPDLTSREVEVLQLIAAGFRNKEVAFQLSVSEATVNAHMKHILSKLDATDRTHAVVIALRRGVIRL